jgi:predicted amidohydrolase YtcJ
MEDPGAFPVAGDLVEALAEAGQPGAAGEVIGRLGALAAAQQHPWGLATADRSRALVVLAEDTTRLLRPGSRRRRPPTRHWGCVGDGDEWLRLNGAGEALTLASVDFENFCEPRPELPGTALDDVEQAVRILAVNDWGFRLHASYGETIDRFLAIFSKLAAEGMFPNGTRWFFDHAETTSRRSIDRIAALGGASAGRTRPCQPGGLPPACAPSPRPRLPSPENSPSGAVG